MHQRAIAGWLKNAKATLPPDDWRRLVDFLLDIIGLEAVGLIVDDHLADDQEREAA